MHEVDHAIEEKVKSALPGVDEVSIHIEPEE
jgi:divalent metal cation (Fe/Co/Zn/Cd) transporter